MKWYGDPTEMGKRIQESRKRRKISQIDLAKQLMISREILSKYENGTRIPNIDKLKEIADLLGVDFVYLVSGYNRENVALEDTGLSNESLAVLRILHGNQDLASKNALAALNILLQNSILLSLIGQYFRNDFAKTFMVDPGNKQPFIEVPVENIKTNTFPYLPIDLQRSTLITIMEYLKIIRDKELEKV